MDNPYYEWSPIVRRQPLRWPGSARVALCVIVSLEFVEMVPPKASVPAPSAVAVGPYPGAYNISEISHHEYGNRVGVFRVMDVLKKHGITPTVAMDAMLAERNRSLVGYCQAEGCEFIGHGVALSRMITERMTEPEERSEIRRSLDSLRAATGDVPLGWVGADYGESTRTVRLLAEAGVQYVCDWPNDEQPYRMNVPAGEIVSLPVTVELDEVFTHRARSIPIKRWSEMVTEAFDRLHQDGADTGRLLVLNLHPYLIGQPFRIRYLDRALAHICGSPGVWAATGAEIVNHFLEQDNEEPTSVG